MNARRLSLAGLGVVALLATGPVAKADWYGPGYGPGYGPDRRYHESWREREWRERQWREHEREMRARAWREHHRRHDDDGY